MASIEIGKFLNIRLGDNDIFILASPSNGPLVIALWKE